MRYTQIAELVNDMTKEYIGQEATPLQEDLSNVVDIGGAIFDVAGFDIIGKSLVDRIGKVKMMERVYSPRFKSIYKDGWEFGSIMQRVYIDELPEAEQNQSYLLEDGQVYETNKFTAIKWYAKYYNGKETFDVPISICDKQIRSAFQSPQDLAAFVSFIENQIETTITVKLDKMIMATINNAVAETFYDLDSTAAATGNYSGKTGTRAVNLLKLYNDTLPDSATPLTPEEFLRTPEAIRFSVKIFKDYLDKLPVLSTQFNVMGKPRFTPYDRMKVYAYAPFINSADVYLQSDIYHNELTEIPFTYEKTPFWQNAGDYSFDVATSIDVKTGGNGHEVKASGILMVLADEWSMAVCCEDPRTTSHYVASAEFTNYWHKQEAMYVNDLSQPLIVFFVA